MPHHVAETRDNVHPSTFQHQIISIECHFTNSKEDRPICSLYPRQMRLGTLHRFSLELETGSLTNSANLSL